MQKNKKALITGINGQDGPYLARFLTYKGYDVYGMIRTSSYDKCDFVKEFGLHKMHLVEGDLSDSTSLTSLIKSIQPDEVYNFAAMSHVGVSFKQPELTADVTGVGVLRLLEAIRTQCPSCKFYQASSSEMIGDVLSDAHDENCEFRPMSPYAVAKLFGHYMVRVYREAYNIYACSGIIFNHESPRRGKRFVTRKITDWIGKYYNNGFTSTLDLGYIDAVRSWGSAEDYVKGMWMSLQHDKPDDYVLCTEDTHSVREFCEVAFKCIGVDIKWAGEGIDEVGMDGNTGQILITINRDFYRPAEVPILRGDCSKAKRELGWKPEMSFEDLVTWMVESDIKLNYVHT